jgi:hypothetical protein
MTQVQGMPINCQDGRLDRSMLALSAAKLEPGGVSPNFVVTHEPPQDDVIFGGKAALRDWRYVTF